MSARHVPIRLGMVGGGAGAMIGNVHRIAARLDGQFALLAGALAVMLVAGLMLEPRIAAVQAQIPSFITDTDSPARQEFRRLHSLSSILNIVVMALTAAAAPVSVVMQGTPWSMAALRTVRSSKNDSRPSGVLMTRAMRRFSSSSPTCGRPSFTL